MNFYMKHYLTLQPKRGPKTDARRKTQSKTSQLPTINPNPGLI